MELGRVRAALEPCQPALPCRGQTAGGGGGRGGVIIVRQFRRVASTRLAGWGPAGSGGGGGGSSDTRGDAGPGQGRHQQGGSTAISPHHLTVIGYIIDLPLNFEPSLIFSSRWCK